MIYKYNQRDKYTDEYHYFLLLLMLNESSKEYILNMIYIQTGII